MTVWLDGDADSVKSPEEDVEPTTSVNGSVCVKLPLVAVSVSVYVPAVVLLFVLIVRVELAALAPVIETGLTLKLELVRAGNPLRLRLTLPVKPPDGVTVIESLALELTATVMVVEEAPSENVPLEAEFTCNETVIWCDRVPLVPVMVNV